MNRSSVGAVLELAALDKHDWELALQRILRIDSHVLRVDRASFWLLGSEPRSLTCELGYVDSADALERGAVLTDVGAGGYLDAVSNAKVTAIENVDDDPRTVDLRAYCHARRIRSMLDVPVWVQSRLAGVVCHEHVGEVRHWTTAEIDFALSVAQVVSTALEARARSRAETNAREASFLAQTSMVLSASLEERVVAERAVAHALPQLADWAVIDRFDGDVVERVAVAHADPGKRELLARYAARFPPRAGAPHMTVQAHALDQAALVADVTDEVLRKNRFSDEQVRMVRELGLHSAIAVPFRTEGGDELAMMFISSKRTYDYDALTLAERYVERVAVALHNARAYRVAQEALRARDEFLAMAAHELRTPITSLRTSCERLEMLTSARPVPAVSAVVERIMRQARRLTRLVNRMLDASLDEQRLPFIVPEPVDLVPLVREVVDELGATRQDATLELTLPPSLVGNWDGERLRQVIANLVENALKYGDHGPIRISLAVEGAEAVLEVADRGIGIDPAVMPRLFKPYGRGVSGRGYGGLGLGLFIARQIVQAHHGSIEVHSELGVGTKFTVRLPRGVSDGK